MSTLNALDPTPEQIKAFLASSETGKPAFMLNLLKFKEKATYKDGEDISGRYAYTRYAQALTQMVEGQEGFGVVFGGNMNQWMIGQGEGDWDAVAISPIPTPKPCSKPSVPKLIEKSTNIAAQDWRDSS